MAENVFQKQLKILVTGGSGFLGRNLLGALAKKNHSVMVLVRPEKKYSFPQKNLEVFYGDFDNPLVLREACRGIDAIIHLAAVIDGKKEKEYRDVNILGTKNLLEAGRSESVGHFIFISSVNAIAGKSYYAISKREAEKLIVDSGLNYTIIRPTLLYGPGEMRNIGFLVSFAKKYKIIPIFGGGRYKLQPLFVGDLAEAIVACLGAPHSFNKIYNLGGPEILTFNQMLTVIKKTLSLRFQTLNLPVAPFLLLGKIGLMPRKICSKLADLMINKTADNIFLRDFDLKLTSFEEGLRKSYE